MTTRENALEKAERLAWTILAVERFGSYGTDEDVGVRMLRAGLIRIDGVEVLLTPLGQEWADRIRAARAKPCPVYPPLRKL